MAERQIPGSLFLTETGSFQAQVPGGPFINQTASSGVTGAASWAEANDTAAGSGSLEVSGTSTTTEANDTASASGTVGDVVAGTIATTEADDTAAASGTLTVSGSSATTETSDTASASGTAGTAFVTEPLMNNTETILANQAVVWSWLPAGRIGALDTVTAVDGSGTTASDGTLTVTGLPAGAGILMVAVQVTGATDDYVYYEAGTVA